MAISTEELRRRPLGDVEPFDFEAEKDIKNISKIDFRKFRTTSGRVCSEVAFEAKLAAIVFNNHKRDIFIFAVATAGIVVGLGVLSGITGGASWAGIEHGLKTISVPWSIGIGSGLAVGFTSGIIWATVYKPYDPTKKEYPLHSTLYERGYHWYDQVKNSATKGVLTTLAGYLVIAAGSVYPTALSLVAGIVGGNYIGTHLIYKMNQRRAEKRGDIVLNSLPTENDLPEAKESSQEYTFVLKKGDFENLKAGSDLQISVSQHQLVTVTPNEPQRY